ncbi:MAG TPA: YciI family protein [Iamia sp.]|nr:YciI family protein [Iamia sp.]
MARYLLSVWFDDTYDDDVSDPETQAQMARTGALTAEMERAGVWVFTAGLPPASAATVVRARGDEVSMTDGPYAETKEQMGGFWVIDVADHAAALDWAARATVACGRPVEVRPTHT